MRGNGRRPKGGRWISASTTNATMLTPAIIAFLSENTIGVTVSMDGPPDLHDKRSAYKSGKAGHSGSSGRTGAG